jgi:crossover junction endodeoxyribonuclease RusA
MITIALPWPSADLSPNSRVHWSARHAASRKAKNYAWGMVKAAMGPMDITYGSWEGPITVQYTFHPPMIRDRDDDNFIARMKPHRDGMALALGVNDAAFITMPVVFGAVKKPGQVVVTLTPLAVKIPHKGQIG